MAWNSISRQKLKSPLAEKVGNLGVWDKTLPQPTRVLPYEWHDTPNSHFLSISDFIEYCHERSIEIEDSVFIGKNKKVRVLPNLFAEIGIFLLQSK